MRNTKQTKLKKRAMLEALEKTLGVVAPACKKAQVSRSQYYYWREHDEDFRQASDDITEMAIDFVESQLFSQIKGGNCTSTIFYLKTKGKKRGYVEKQEVDLKGNMSHDGKIEIVTKDQLDDDIGYTES